MSSAKNTEKANAEMAKKKVELARLMAKLQAKIAALPDDTQGRWGHVGDANYMIEQLQELTGEVG